MDGKLISLERSDVERNLISHCEKQSANHKPAYDQVCVTRATSPSILYHRLLLSQLHISYAPKAGACKSMWCVGLELFMFLQPEIGVF